MVDTYKEAGVDVSAIRDSQSSIGNVIKTTHSDTDTIHGFGHYAGLVRIDGSTLLATHTDGVGTKVMIAGAMNRYDTVGIDCMAMNVNDIICVGATPVSFVDYIAANRNDSDIFTQIVQGLAHGAREAGVPIVGGETAILPDLFGRSQEFVFDLAGTVTGLVDENRVILGNNIRVGDIILGAHSTGLHSNGYTLARKVLFPKYSIHDNVRGVGRVGEALLEPTRIYAKPVLDILKVSDVHGLAHITGGSFTKLTRLRDVGFEITALPTVPPIMRLIEEQGVDSLEMYKTFNMGIGLCIVVPPDEEDTVVSAFKKYRIPVDNIGQIVGKKGVRVKSRTIV